MLLEWQTFLNIIEVLGTTPSEFFKDSENESIIQEGRTSYL